AAAVHEHDGGERPRAGGQRQIAAEGDGAGGDETTFAAGEAVGRREGDAAAVLGREPRAGVLERRRTGAGRQRGEERHRDDAAGGHPSSGMTSCVSTRSERFTLSGGSEQPGSSSATTPSS